MAVSGGVDPMDIDHDDGGGSGSPSSGSAGADRGVDHDGGSLPGLGIVAAVLGVVHHDGRTGRPQGRDRGKGGGGAGGHLSGHSALLRHLRSAGRGDGQRIRRRRPTTSASCAWRARLHQGLEPDAWRWSWRGASIPGGVRPTFQEMEAACRGGGASLPRRHSDGRTEAAPPPPHAPIFVIKRKKAGHGGHHGGAWKVAYADFVTAMMALFIVLWLMSADKKVKEAISAFFNNPTGTGQADGHGRRGRGQCHRSAERGHGQAARKDRAGAQDGAQFPQPEGPRGNDDHRRRPAHRTAGNGGRNVLRIGPAAADRRRRASC